ncbi:MAG: polysaccharide pyruvyl transferase family protein [Eubacteriales bacterium]|nr:polysaccharide pyruvyl transferase family protein [Eubacteriales bacterium]
MNFKNRVFLFCRENDILYFFYRKGSYIFRKVLYYYRFVKPILKYKASHNNPVFLIFTPEHANLGDHAITAAEYELLLKLKIDFYEITGKTLFILKSYSFLSKINGSTVLVNGGGNLGNLWPDIEEMNHVLVQTLSKSRIIFLPNSFYYSQDLDGKTQLEVSKKIYNAHSDITFYAREKISYERMQKNYHNVRLAPDMVFRLNRSTNGGSRKGCLLCLRDDIESALNNECKRDIISQVKEVFGDNFILSNTVLDHYVTPENRDSELQKKFDEFSSAELVITDRLHGMIFAAITGTKCIAFVGKSPKIQGCYSWIKELPYVKLVNDIEEIKPSYMGMPNYPFYYDENLLNGYYSELEHQLQELVI